MTADRLAEGASQVDGQPTMSWRPRTGRSRQMPWLRRCDTQRRRRHLRASAPLLGPPPRARAMARHQRLGGFLALETAIDNHQHQMAAYRGPGDNFI
jgi:hypothetical protein